MEKQPYMQKDLQLANASIDPETGFLTFPPDHKTGKTFDARAKVDFLRVFKETGNQEQAMAANGFSTRILLSHLKADREFQEAFKEVIFGMEARLTGTMFQNGLTPKGTLDRFGWLRAHNPEKWAPKLQHTTEDTDKEKLLALFKEATIDVTPKEGV